MILLVIVVLCYSLLCLAWVEFQSVLLSACHKQTMLDLLAIINLNLTQGVTDHLPFSYCLYLKV